MPSVLKTACPAVEFARRLMRNLPGPKRTERTPTALFVTTAIKRMANTSKAAGAARDVQRVPTDYDPHWLDQAVGGRA
jgi:hypothetical protein